MFNSKSKRLVIIVLDLIIGFIIKCWASKIFPNINDLLLPSFFFVFLLVRIIVDLFLSTVEDQYYKIKVSKDLTAMKHILDMQKVISAKMKEAMLNNDTGKYSELDKIMKKL